MKKGILTTGLALLLATASIQAANDEAERFGSGEFSIDLFGSGSIGEESINRLSGARIQHDMRIGAGAGINYFFTRQLGIGGEAFSESLSGRFVDNASVSLIVRLPIGDSGFAPYVFGGGGRQFDPSQFWNAHLGAGLECRITSKFGLFVDGRYIMGEGGRNFGEGRAGVRFVF